MSTGPKSNGVKTWNTNSTGVTRGLRVFLAAAVPRDVTPDGACAYFPSSGAGQDRHGTYKLPRTQ